jgi:2-polyprenyl-6-methoxyphenol hydroxylase-like FAD-dependent oxidoreductase
MTKGLLAAKKVAIVGGGPGGLTLARLLQLKGAEVHVYERDLNKDVRVQGATLDLHEESGLRALEEAGLMEQFRAHYRPGAEKVRILDQHGRIFLDQHTDTRALIDRPEIDRGPLRNILLDALQPGTVVWDSRFVSLRPAGTAWELVFESGRTALADIVIGADGANSKIRPYVTSTGPVYSGMTVIEGSVYNAALTTPCVYELLKGGKLFVFGDEKSLIISSKGDGSIAFYTGNKKAEQWSGPDLHDQAQMLVWFKQHFAGWNDIWNELFENAAMPLVLRPQYYMPLDQHWVAQSHITLLGDAAHLMPPYAGEGVNMAMLDAVELSDCLTGNSFPDLLTAIAHYETQMRKRASETAALTLEQTIALHSPDAIANTIAVMS